MKTEPLFFRRYHTVSVSGSVEQEARRSRAEVSVLDQNRGKATETSGRVPPPDKIDQAVKQINDYLQTVQRNLQFSIDKDTKQIVVRVIDASTGEVIRQIPPESVLEMARSMQESKGLLFAQRA